MSVLCSLLLFRTHTHTDRQTHTQTHTTNRLSLSFCPPPSLLAPSSPVPPLVPLLLALQCSVLLPPPPLPLPPGPALAARGSLITGQLPQPLWGFSPKSRSRGAKQPAPTSAAC